MINKEDLTFETRQDPAVVEKVLADLGFTGSTVETHSDEGVDAPVPETPAAEPEPVAAEPAPNPQPPTPAVPRPSSGYKKKWETTAAENERLKQELEAARKATPAAEPATSHQPPATAVEPVPSHETPAVEAAAAKPKPEDFENGIYDPAFVEAITDWKYDERARIDREKVTTAARETEVQARKDSDTRDQEAFNTWRNNQLEEAKARHDDFDVVTNTKHDVDIWNDVMTEAVWSFDQGAELAYWLATHEVESHRICELTSFDKKTENIVAFRKKLARAVHEMAKIELPEPAAIEDETPIEETQPAAQPVAAVAAAAAAPAPSKTAPAPRSPAPALKPAPPSPVGSGARSTSPVKSLSQMTKDGTLAAHLAKFPSDPTAEYRRLRKAEYGH